MAKNNETEKKKAQPGLGFINRGHVISYKNKGSSRKAEGDILGNAIKAVPNKE